MKTEKEYFDLGFATEFSPIKEKLIKAFNDGVATAQQDMEYEKYDRNREPPKQSNY